MLEIGKNTSFVVREEFIHACSSLKAVFLSDFHFTKHSKAFANDLAESLNRINPDLILFGGDYFDSKKGRDVFTYLISLINKPIIGVVGNHDKFMRIDKKFIQKSYPNFEWLNEKRTLEINGKKVLISSKENEEFADIQICLVHNPKEFKKAKKNFHCYLAGHLHGSQFVFWKKDHSLFPGKFFYKWNIDKGFINSAPVIINRGLGDSLPIRFNCPKEIVVLNFKEMTL